MLEEVSALNDLEVFTPWGVKVGDVANIEIDSESTEIENIFLEVTNDRLVQDGASILIPYRWIQAVGDIIILRHFPEDLPIKTMEDFGPAEFR
ncbi:MAG: PRC-barrel domain-containing protein [Thermoplasmatota archaeon]